MHVNDVLTDDEVADGWVLTCQSVPTTRPSVHVVYEELTMEPSQVADVIEIEQLLARYAVGMTKDDVEAVIDVFTPDGTYSAFGDTYPLADFPTLVAAAPKGLFLIGPPAIELDGDTGTGEQPLCFVDQTEPRHAHRLVHRHLPPHPARLAPAHAVDDVPAQQRRPRLGQGARPDPPEPPRAAEAGA